MRLQKKARGLRENKYSRRAGYQPAADSPIYLTNSKRAGSSGSTFHSAGNRETVFTSYPIFSPCSISALLNLKNHLINTTGSNLSIILYIGRGADTPLSSFASR